LKSIERPKGRACLPFISLLPAFGWLAGELIEIIILRPIMEFYFAINY